MISYCALYLSFSLDSGRPRAWSTSMAGNVASTTQSVLQIEEDGAKSGLAHFPLRKMSNLWRSFVECRYRAKVDISISCAVFFRGEV